MSISKGEHAVFVLLNSATSVSDLKNKLVNYKKSQFFLPCELYEKLIEITSQSEGEYSLEIFGEAVSNVLPADYQKLANQYWRRLKCDSSLSSLRECYRQHKGKISDKWSSYLDVYDRVLSEYRDQAISLLEIGVQNGGSLEIWNKYFPHAERLIGCDINPKCGELVYEQSNINIVVGDAGEANVSKLIREQCPAFDIIIDDGSHVSSDCIKNLRNYYKYVKPGGVYILEDLHCSYWQEFEGGLKESKSIINRLKEFVDYPNYEFWGHIPSNLEEKEREIGGKNADFRDIESISFFNSMVVIRKSKTPITLVGKRVITGTQGAVTGDEYIKNNDMEINRR